MMTYDYKIINADWNFNFAKRVALYIALLCFIVAIALVILFILFERYLALLIPGGLILVSACVWIILGKKTSAFSYHFTENVLEVNGNNSISVVLKLANVQEIKTAEKSDFFDKSIIKLCFINCKIVMKTHLNYSTEMPDCVVVSIESNRYILGLDEYAIALLGGEK